MRTVYVLRHAQSYKGVFGTMFGDDKIPFAVTLENDETVFPAGQYVCQRGQYYAGGYPTFEIIVPGRSRILFHRLNWEEQSKGCIGVGESYAILDGRPAISQSKDGFGEFWERYKDESSIILIVREFHFEEHE